MLPGLPAVSHHSILCTFVPAAHLMAVEELFRIFLLFSTSLSYRKTCWE